MGEVLQERQQIEPRAPSDPTGVICADLGSGSPVQPGAAPGRRCLVPTWSRLTLHPDKQLHPPPDVVNLPNCELETCKNKRLPQMKTKLFL